MILHHMESRIKEKGVFWGTESVKIGSHRLSMTGCVSS